MAIFQLQNRGEIRRSIGLNMGIVTIGEATSTTDTSSIIDLLYLQGGDDEHNQKQVKIYDAAGSIVDGEISIVSDYTGSTHDATCAPVFTAAVTDGDKYEMWESHWRIADIDDAINQSIIGVTSLALVDRMTDSNFTLSDIYEYDWLTPYAFGNDFKAVSKVEYVYNTGTYHDIHLCESAWDEYVLPTYVTVTADSSFNIEGNYANKIAVTDGYSANDIFATDNITSLDMSDCDEIEIFIRSSVALDAGDLQLLLSATANCASALESLAIPATLANTNTIHVIDLANPHLDTAIISVGIKDIVDKDAITLYVDRIKAVQSGSKVYKSLSNEHWDIVKGSSPKFKLTDSGLSQVGANTQVRISGFAAPDIFSDDTTDSEIDPAYLIAQTTGRLLISHAKSSYLDIHDRAELSKYWLGEANRKLPGLTPNMSGDVRSV